jgi:alkaline phosphatase
MGPTARRLLAAAVALGALTIWAVTVSAGGNGDARGAAPGPPNVILLLGDGMGDSEITMARNYWKGADGRLALDTLPSTGAYTTHSVDEHDPERPDYVADSAATATAFATGVKTSDKRISTAPGTDEDLETVLELAQDRDMRTGLVTTGGVSTATPAAFSSHVRLRACMGPESMLQCIQDKKSLKGPGSIAEQQIDHGVDVLLGGGRTYFEHRIQSGPDEGRTVVEAARRQGYEVAFDAAGLAEAGLRGRLLGLFSPVGMSPEWDGERAEPGEGTGPQRCQTGRRPAEQPSLPDMARVALDRLENDRGFFLLLEGAAIDTHGHESNPCRQIGEAVTFDRTVRLALDYAEEHPNTLVIVTADHGHAAQIVPVDAEPNALPPGRYSTLETKDGARMRISYATTQNGIPQKHTGTQVRIAARGPGAERVEGVTDQTDLFETMKAALGVE